MPLTPITIRKYIAIINQLETSPPTANIIINTIGTTPIWTRQSAGNYKLTATGLFTADKSFLTNWFNYDGGATTYQPIFDGSDIVGWWTLYDNGNNNDMVMEVVDQLGASKDIDEIVNGSALYIDISVVL